MKRTWTDRRFPLGERIVAGVLSALLPLATMPEAAWALPHGGVVAKGAATLSYSTSKLLITQTTSSATFDWGSFNVRSGQSVVYKTPGSSSVSMNYIGGTTPSSINGTVTSNGILYFMNPNGLIFGSGSVVSAAGVMAFGSSTPWGKPTGAVNNAGVLTATNNGTVALVGTSVTNTGTIMAPGGEVLLAAGSTVTPISATDGSSLSVATTGGGLVDDSGILSADTANGKTGTILLQSGMESGTVTLEPTAVLDASAPKGGNGGQVVLNASGVVLDNTAPINVSAPYGTNGTIKIDPDYILSGTTLDICNAAGLEYLDGNQSSYLSDTINLESNMNLASSSAPYNWTPLGNSSTPFTGTFNGNNYVVSGYTIGTSSSPFSGNDVGFIGYLGSGGKVENLGVGGMIYASGNNVGGIVGSNNNGTVEYSYNTGTINGSGDLAGIVGFNYNGAIVQYSYNTGAISGGYNVGGVVGTNDALVQHSYNTGTVSGSDDVVGGVAGVNNGSVQDSYNTGSVISSCSFVGGIVGSNNGTLQNSYNSGVISSKCDVGGIAGNNNGTLQYSYNTGSISGSNDVGGVVGLQSKGTVTESYYNSFFYTGSEIGSGGGSSTGLPEGTSSGDLGNSASYSSWSFASGWTGKGFGVPGTWIIGTVYPNEGNEAVSAPILVPDLPTVTLMGKSGLSVYSGSTVSPGYTTTYTMGGNAIPTGVTVTTSVGPNAGSHSFTPTVSGSFSTPTTQTSVDSILVASGTWSITPAPLTVTANKATMTYGGIVPPLSGTVTGFVVGQTLSKDAMSLSWSTSATSTSPIGTYGVTGSLAVLVGNPYSVDYTIVQAPGNASALTITAANSTSGLSGSSGSGSSSSGPGTPGGVTSTHFPPVAQTANLSVSASGNSSSDNLSDTGNSSSSGDSITLSSSNGSSLSVVPTGGGETTGDAILSTQELKQ